MPQSLRSYEELDRLGRFYHSFAAFGIAVPHDSEGTKGRNQRTKEGPICGYLRRAIDGTRAAGTTHPSVLELFCADGYYAAHARRMGAGTVHGIDTNEKHVRKANAIFSVLYGDMPFRVADVRNLTAGETYDVVLCCGGLYHLADPAELLRACHAYARRFLVVQTVVSLDHDDDPGYFSAPAPGLERGCRFSAPWLERTLAQAGWNVLDWHRNRNPGCTEERDAGSVFALCSPVTDAGSPG